MANLGVMYKNGVHGKHDYGQALMWLRKSANGGDAWGIANLGDMYANGQGVSKNLREALTLYRLAADKGDQHAKDAINKSGKPSP